MNALATKPLDTYVPPRLGEAPRDVDLRAYLKATKDLGLQQFLWELDAASAMYARDSDHWLFGETCFVVARRNGKTTLVQPRIVEGLRRGERILHTAHNRELPREQTFVPIASRAARLFEGLNPKVRWANGSEKVELSNGGSYRITSDRQGAGRGHGGDVVIVDEIREQETFDLISALGPTLADSANPQVIYLSNAGHEGSVVLNDLRERHGRDPNLCYLEWSAPPERDRADREGWLGANPALPMMPWMWDYLEKAFVRYADQPAIFDTEHLCLWVTSMAPPLVSGMTWTACEKAELGAPSRPYLAVALAPSGRRASAVLAWQDPSGVVVLQVVVDVESETGLDLRAVGQQFQREAMRRKVRATAYSGITDEAVARYLPRAQAIDGRAFANASSAFATNAESRMIRHAGGRLTEDVLHTVRKSIAAGVWTAVPASEEVSPTTALAAIRAAWLASAPPPPKPRIH